MLVPSSGDGFYGAVVSGVEQRARERDYHVLLAMSHAQPEREREAFEVFLSQRVDAVISVSPVGGAETMAVPASAGLPSVIINWDVGVPGQLVRCAWPPERLVVSRAWSGRSRRSAATTSASTIGTVASWPPSISLCSGAAAGVRRRCPDPVECVTPRGVSHGADGGRSVATTGAAARADDDGTPGDDGPVPAERSTTDRRRRVHDLTAISVLRATAEAGWAVPEDVSVIGTDDIEMAQYTRPALTTVAQPTAEYGELAVDAVLSKRGLGDRLLSGTLVERESTTSPSRRRRGGGHTTVRRW